MSEYIVEIAVGIGLSLGVLLLKQLDPLLKMGFQYLVGLTSNAYLQRVLVVVEEVVRASNQVFVENMKEASKDGKVTKEEVLNAFSQAKDKAISKGKECLIGAPKSVKAFIEDKLDDIVESAVNKVKHNPPQ